MVDNNDVESLWRPAEVCLPDAFDQATGDDVFVCEYEYDTVWQVSALLALHSTRSHCGWQFMLVVHDSCNIA